MIEDRWLFKTLLLHNIFKTMRITNIYNTSRFKISEGLDGVNVRRVKIDSFLPFMKPKSKQAVRALKTYSSYGEMFEQRMLERFVELMYDIEHVGIVVEIMQDIIREAEMSEHEVKTMYANFHSSRVVFKRMMKILNETLEQFKPLEELTVKRAVAHHVCDCAYKELNRAKQKHGTLASAVHTAVKVSRVENKILGTYQCIDRHGNTVWHITTISPHKWL